MSAALEVVKAIGALKSAVADTVQGDISKEYLIVCAQHVSNLFQESTFQRKARQKLEEIQKWKYKIC